MAIAAMLSCVIEILQISVITGRDSSTRDVLMNTLGGLVGALLADGWRRLAFPSRAAGRRLAWLGAVCWLLVSVGEAAMLERAFLPTIWYGQRAPDGVFPATFTGHVLAARVNSLDLPGTRLPNADLVRAALLQDRWTLTVEATTGEPTPDLSSLFSIFDGEQREMLVVGQKGTDLIVRYRTRAANVGFRSPSILLPRAFALAPGEPVRISLSFNRGVISLTTTCLGRTVSREVSVTPSWGWSLLLLFDGPIGPLSPLWSGVWIAALLIPTGYWMERGMAMREALAFGGLLVILGTALIPVLFQLPPPGPAEWIGGAAGPVSGWWLGRAVSRIDRNRTAP